MGQCLAWHSAVHRPNAASYYDSAQCECRFADGSLTLRAAAPVLGPLEPSQYTVSRLEATAVDGTQARLARLDAPLPRDKHTSCPSFESICAKKNALLDYPARVFLRNTRCCSCPRRWCTIESACFSL